MGGELNPYEPPRAPLESPAHRPETRLRRRHYFFGFMCVLGFLAVASLAALLVFQ